MRCLSIMQPWAWLIVHGYKPVENRNWPTKVRGRVLIHAGKKVDRVGLEWVLGEFPLLQLPTTFETGGIVGVARVIDCVQRLDSPWFFGPYGFVLTEQKPLAFMPLRGQLGFFDVPRDVVKSLRPQGEGRE